MLGFNRLLELRYLEHGDKFKFVNGRVTYTYMDYHNGLHWYVDDVSRKSWSTPKNVDVYKLY